MSGGFRDVFPTVQTSTVDKPSIGSSVYSAVDTLDATKVFVRDFLHRLQYAPPDIPANPELRREVADVTASWNVGVDWEYIEALTETSCSMAESPYAHTSYEHQRLVAIYTACVAYIDDLGHRNLEALGHADAIITSTIDATTAMYIQVVSQGDVISPSATRYPFYLRLKAGIAPAYAHFNFTKSWGDAIGTYYLQVIPELELMCIGFNDILSFYKETLAGETSSYVRMRANAEQKTTDAVLRELVEENLQSWYKVKQIASVQSGLADICVGHLMPVGYVEFHFKARRRYRLHEILGQS